MIKPFSKVSKTTPEYKRVWYKTCSCDYRQTWNTGMCTSTTSHINEYSKVSIFFFISSEKKSMKEIYSTSNFISNIICFMSPKLYPKSRCGLNLLMQNIFNSLFFWMFFSCIFFVLYSWQSCPWNFHAHEFFFLFSSKTYFFSEMLGTIKCGY